MSQDRSATTPARRSFLSRLAAGAGAFGAAFAGATSASAQPAGSAPRAFVPARHPEDDWFDETTARHRFFLDSTTAEAGGQALFFARNVFAANASGYKLTDADVAQIICLRHGSTSFAFNDAMWAKYGASLSARSGNFVDPKSGQVPTFNVYLASTTYGDALRNVNVTIEQMAKRGVRFAVCGLSTRATAQLAAQKSGGNADAIFKELSGNMVPNAHLVPAGIVAVSRAQERGYAYAYVE